MPINNESDAKVAIVGLGYVGTCLAAVLAETGLQIHGIDIDQELVSEVQAGNCPIEESNITERFEQYAADGRITASINYDEIKQCDTILVTVGTPLAEANPDITAVQKVSEKIGDRLQQNQHVIFRSTIPARTTETVVEPTLSERSGMTVGEDYFLAFCPERMAEGSAYEDLTSLPVVVGGMTETCRQRSESFWQSSGIETIAVSSPTAAELTKLADNWWIDLNIAMANEVALLAEELGVDAMEVIEAANSLPKGQHHVNILYPGAGVGGSCLVKDPWFVANLGEKHDLNLQTPRVSRQINDQMPTHVVNRTIEALNHAGENEVAILGYAFKSGTDDARNTPAKQIAEGLLDAGVSLRISDPFVPASVIDADLGIEPQRLPDALSGVTAVVVVTGHDRYQKLSVDDLIELVGHTEFAVVDGRFTFSPAEFEDTEVKYVGIGRGQTLQAQHNEGDSNE